MYPYESNDLDPVNDDNWRGKPSIYNHNSFETTADTIQVVGSLYGARSFIAEPDGALVGATYHQVWKPGENLATCWQVTGWSVAGLGITKTRPAKQHRDVPTGKMIETSKPGKPDEKILKPETKREFLGWKWELPTGETGMLPPNAPEPHPVYRNDQNPEHSLITCGCGFHSYWRGSLDYATNAKSVNGIVRAWGTIRRGDRGMRSQYAEIVALYIPEEDGEKDLVGNYDPLSKAFRRAGKALPDNLVEAISDYYPNVPIYRDLDEMLALHDMEPPKLS